MTGEYGTNQQFAPKNSGGLLGNPNAGLNGGLANVVDHGQYQQGNLGWYWHPDYYYGARTIVVVAPGHRVCACPNCAGDCCACADCKVKRLEKRVADLEAEKS